MVLNHGFVLDSFIYKYTCLSHFKDFNIGNGLNTQDPSQGREVLCIHKRSKLNLRLVLTRFVCRR